MKITLFIRRDQMRPTYVTMRTDFNHENSDTPRINQLGLAIKEQLDEIISSCAKDCKIKKDTTI